jgi:hypothetical protein
VTIRRPLQPRAGRPKSVWPPPSERLGHRLRKTWKHEGNRGSLLARSERLPRWPRSSLFSPFPLCFLRRKYDIACGQIDIGNAATDMAAAMKSGAPENYAMASRIIAETDSREADQAVRPNEHVEKILQLRPFLGLTLM